MVKLIRLASDDDCKFNADLDQGIKLKENSQIALQNLTFDTEDFQLIQVADNVANVEFSLNQAVGFTLPFHTATLKADSYTSANINDLYEDLQSKLNMCCKTDNSSTNNAYHSFFLTYDGKPLYEGVSIEGVFIYFKLNPMSMMFNFNHDGRERIDEKTLFDSSPSPVNGANEAIVVETTYDGTNLRNLGNCQLYPTDPATATHDAFIMPNTGIVFSRGSGMYMARIHNLVDNGGTADTNGFAIGFSFTNLRKETNGGRTAMTNAMRDFELRVKRPTDDFEFVEPSVPNTNQISTGNAPHLYSSTTTPNQLEHDLILFEKDAQIITCKIIDTSAVGGSSTTIFSYTMTDEQHEKDLYPYIIMYGEQPNAQIGLPVITVDNNINPLNQLDFGGSGDDVDNDIYEIVGQEQELVNTATNVYDLYKVLHGNGLPNGGNGFRNDIFSNTGVDTLATYEPELKIHTRIIQNMGFEASGNRQFTFRGSNTVMSSNGDARTLLGGFDLQPDGDINDTVSSDNYIVVLDSHQLKSFDASEYDYSVNPNAINPSNKRTKRGRQKSILATIPESDSSGKVEFEANELVYIDLDNKFDMELKNLKLRVLNKQFEEIRTNGTSIMTLLVKD